jgi:hypothetical protein
MQNTEPFFILLKRDARILREPESNRTLWNADVYENNTGGLNHGRLVLPLTYPDNNIILLTILFRNTWNYDSPERGSWKIQA